VIDSFPFDEWSEDITSFWTFGPENSTGTYVLTVLGIILMVAALIYWVWLENRKLTAQAELLRGAGGLPPASPTAPGPGFDEPPLAGPSTEPGP
jgi:hypothetical protein